MIIKTICFIIDMFNSHYCNSRIPHSHGQEYEGKGEGTPNYILTLDQLAAVVKVGPDIRGKECRVCREGERGGVNR